MMYQYFRGWQITSNTFVSIIGVLGVVVAFVAVIALVVFVQSAERRIPVNYAKRVIGRKMYGGQSTYLPIKVNQAGVQRRGFISFEIDVETRLAARPQRGGLEQPTEGEIFINGEAVKLQSC